MNVILRDLDLKTTEMALVIYHQTGVLIDLNRIKPTATRNEYVDTLCLLIAEAKPQIELKKLFHLHSTRYIRRGKYSEGFDLTIFWLKIFRRTQIDLRYFPVNSDDLDILRKVSPPLYDWLTLIVLNSLNIQSQIDNARNYKSPVSV